MTKLSWKPVVFDEEAGESGWFERIEGKRRFRISISKTQPSPLRNFERRDGLTVAANIKTRVYHIAHVPGESAPGIVGLKMTEEIKDDDPEKIIQSLLKEIDATYPELKKQ